MTQLVGEPPEPDDELLTLYQVAELLYAHPETVHQWLRRGWLRGVHVDDASAGGAIGRRSTSASDKSSSSGKAGGCERNARGAAISQRRRFGVSVVAIIVALSAPANALLIAVEHGRVPLPERTVDVFAGVVTLIGIAIAIGLRRLKHWAWAAAILWSGTMLAAGLALYHAGDKPWETLVVGIAIVFFLNESDVQRTFTSP
jgi:hypothetical protein